MHYFDAGYIFSVSTLYERKHDLKSNRKSHTFFHVRTLGFVSI